MNKFAVDCTINETLFIDAMDADEAAVVAEQQMSEGYDVAPGQVEVTNVKAI